MKEVNVETVGYRVSVLEKKQRIFGLTLFAEFELACLRRLLEFLTAEGHTGGNDGWVEWNGGKKPVASSQAIQIKLRTGEVFTSPKGGHSYEWRHFDREYDIIAYRVIGNGGTAADLKYAIKAGYTLGHADALILREAMARLEKAEAEFAELKRLKAQEPQYQIQKFTGTNNRKLWIDVGSKQEAEAQSVHGYSWRAVYPEPRPAAAVPVKVPDIIHSQGETTAYNDYYALGWNACRAEMLRRIEAAK